jgi:putative ATP-binding cassette transporter
MGSLRAAIAYPSPPATFSGDALCGALQHVGLEHLVARLDETNGWEQALPAGEQQRIGFARLLLHRPAWIFIQEATDALDPKDEEAMMRLLQDELGEATVITIGHHPAIEAFHRRKLVLAREGQVVVVREQPLA